MTRLDNRARHLGDAARDSDWLERAVRAGLVAYGVVHLMVAWVAGQLALGERRGDTSSTGALQELAQQPLGGVLVWLVAAGMLLLVVWRLLEAALGHRGADGGERTRKRLGSALKAAVYAAVGVSALRVATGSGGSSGSGGRGQSSDALTAEVMGWPGGQLLVGAVGVAVLGYGAHHLWRAWTEQYAGQLSAEGRSGEAGTAYLWAGRIGYAAKGLAIGVVGGLFVYAAATHEPRRSGGLDQALREVLDQPFGPVLLLLMAAGIACYGLFCLARARHLARV